MTSNIKQFHCLLKKKKKERKTNYYDTLHVVFFFLLEISVPLKSECRFWSQISVFTDHRKYFRTKANIYVEYFTWVCSFSKPFSFSLSWSNEPTFLHHLRKRSEVLSGLAEGKGGESKNDRQINFITNSGNLRFIQI